MLLQGYKKAWRLQGKPLTPEMCIRREYTVRETAPWSMILLRSDCLDIVSLHMVRESFSWWDRRVPCNKRCSHRRTQWFMGHDTSNCAEWGDPAKGQLPLALERCLRRLRRLQRCSVTFVDVTNSLQLFFTSVIPVTVDADPRCSSSSSQHVLAA